MFVALVLLKSVLFWKPVLASCFLQSSKKCLFSFCFSLKVSSPFFHPSLFFLWYFFWSVFLVYKQSSLDSIVGIWTFHNYLLIHIPESSSKSNQEGKLVLCLIDILNWPSKLVKNNRVYYRTLRPFLHFIYTKLYHLVNDVFTKTPYRDWFWFRNNSNNILTAAKSCALHFDFLFVLVSGTMEQGSVLICCQEKADASRTNASIARIGRASDRDSKLEPTPKGSSNHFVSSAHTQRRQPCIPSLQLIFTVVVIIDASSQSTSF